MRADIRRADNGCEAIKERVLNLRRALALDLGSRQGLVNAICDPARRARPA
jgi:hypothetical protein